METYNLIVRFFQNGGPFMYPIAIVLVVGLAIAVERWLVLSTARASNRKAFDSIMKALKGREYKSVLSAGKDSRVPMYRIVAAGIARFLNNNRRDEIESAMEEGVMEALPRLEKRTQYLATLATIPDLQRSRTQLRNALAVLLARPPAPLADLEGEKPWKLRPFSNLSLTKEFQVC